MAIKKSVRLSDETEQLCKLMSVHGALNWSRSINTIADRYNVMIEKSLPELTENERLAICQAYNGYMKSDSIMHEVAGLEFTISEAYQYDENVKALLLGAKSASELLAGDGVAISELLEKVRGWSVVERIAVIDMTERFWNKDKQFADEE